MFRYKGVWMPDGEKHLPVWMARSGFPKRGDFHTYQYHKYEAALKWCDKRRVAIDVGAFIGQWSRVMAMDFERVIAFEPVDKHRECWYTNMDGVDNAMLRHSALGASDGYIGLKNYTLGSHGDTCVSDDLDTEVVATAEMTTLDHLNIQDVDLIKIDVEGFEHNVLSGAMKTLQQRPVIIIEQKTNQDALPILEQMGAIQREVIKGDYIYSWD